MMVIRNVWHVEVCMFGIRVGVCMWISIALVMRIVVCVEVVGRG